MYTFEAPPLTEPDAIDTSPATLFFSVHYILHTCCPIRIPLTAAAAAAAAACCRKNREHHSILTTYCTMDDVQQRTVKTTLNCECGDRTYIPVHVISLPSCMTAVVVVVCLFGTIDCRTDHTQEIILRTWAGKEKRWKNNTCTWYVFCTPPKKRNQVQYISYNTYCR